MGTTAAGAVTDVITARGSVGGPIIVVKAIVVIVAIVAMVAVVVVVAIIAIVAIVVVVVVVAGNIVRGAAL